jgi:ATP-binding cassette subfamily F protein 3
MLNLHENFFVRQSTMLKILSGEIEPTAGAIAKSPSTLRVAYLKQEFAESIVPSRSLKDELLSSFTEELEILADIAQCEAALADTVDDADRMDAVLARMQRLQDLAIAKQCYALEPRVQKVMDSMGFTREDGEALVGTFSGGWKMRIGLAKILLLDP